MSRRLIIDKSPFGLRGAILEDDRLTAILDAEDETAVTDAIFVGRVTAIDTRLGAAFVDIGRSQPGFLNARDIRRAVAEEQKVPISRLVREGQKLLVQGLREAEGDKGPRVSADLKLLGLHLVYRPLASEEERPLRVRGAARQKLQDRAASLFPGRSVALKKLALDADDNILVDEQRLLEERFAKLERALAQGRVGKVADDASPLEKLVMTAASGPLETIEVADTALAASLRGLIRDRLAHTDVELIRLEDSGSAFEQAEVDAELEAALAPEFELAGGGRLIIETTAAFVAVDVDGGGRGALDVNVEAAHELARLVRLRNLGGTIVVDFIDLPTKPQRLHLETQLKTAFRDDPLPVDIYPMSPLGIVQISRAKRGQSLDARLTRNCPECAGSGRAASLRLRAEGLWQALEQDLRATASVAPDLAAYLADRGGSFTARTKTDRSLSPGAWSLQRGGGHG